MEGRKILAAARRLPGGFHKFCRCESNRGYPHDGNRGKFHGKKPIILLDEYDTPMQEAWVQGYWEKAVKFFKSFFGASFKNRDCFDRAIITGITRISKESIFSELNHLDVITTTSDEYAEYFGFTENEVFQALDHAGMGEHKAGVKQWHDGFTFGSHTVANAHLRIREKLYEAALTAKGFLPENIRKYGFAFQGKKCLIG